MGLRDAAAQGVLWTALQAWGKRLTALITFIALARLLDPADFGLVALATVFIQLLMTVQESGFAQAIIQREELDDLHLDTGLWFSVGVGVAMAGALALLAAPTAGALGSPDLAPVLRSLSPLLVLSGLRSVPSAILTRSLRFKALALRDTLAAVVSGVVGIGLALGGAGVYALVGQQLAQALVAVVVLWAASGWRPSGRFSRRHLRDLAGFGAAVVGINLLGTTSRQSDNLLIGTFLGEVALGAYTVGYGLLTTLTELAIKTTSQVVRPTFARLQTEPRRLREAFYAATRMSSLVAMPMFLGLSAVAPEAVEVLFGEGWAAAVPVMRILGFVGALHAMTFMIGNVIVAMGRPGVSLKLGVANAVLNVAGFALAIAAGWGIVGVAAVYTVRAYLMTPVHLEVLRRLLAIEYRTYVRCVAPAVLCSLATWVAADQVTDLLADRSALLRLGVGVACGAAVYTLAIGALFRPVAREAVDFARRARRAGRTAPAEAPDDVVVPT